MSQLVVLLASTLRDVRQAAAHRVCVREKTLVLGNSPGIARGWREAFRATGEPSHSRLPRFAALSEWFLEAATLTAAPAWSTRADRRFLLRALLPRLRPRLKVLHRLCRSNELVRQLDLLIADLRHAGYETFDFGGDWSDDLQLVVGEYNRLLRERGARDIESAPAIWTQSQTLFDAPEIPCVVFDQLLAPSPVQWRGVLRLCAQAQSTLVPLALPWLDGATTSWDEALAQAENSALAGVLRMWRDAGAELEIVAPDAARDERQNAVRALLSYRQTEAPPNFDLTAAYSPRDEMERVASHLRARCSAPQALENRALVLPDAATYAGVLAPTFAAHGVPIHVRRARPHGTYPLVTRVLHLLQLHESDWNLDEIADLFGDGLLRLCSDENENSGLLDIHRLRAACFKARLDTLRDESDCLERLSESNGENLVLDPNLAHDLACLARLREATARLNAARDAATWRDELSAIVEMTLGHLWREAESTPGDSPSPALLQIEAFLSAAENVAARFERWQPKILRNKNREHSAFAEFIFDCLRLELENATAPLEEKNGVALEVLSPLQLLNDVPREVYFAGLIEGAWPASGAPSTLLARHQRELAPLRAHQIDPTLLARYQLALMVVEAEAVHLLHPLQSGGREVLRSPLLEDLALCWQNIPLLPRASTPTSRAALLQMLGESAKTVAPILGELQFSESWRAALQTAGVEAAQLSTLLRIERERSDAQTMGIYDGALGERGARLLREVNRLQGRESELIQLSATGLKSYAQCPLKYFARSVLGLKTPILWQDELPANESGTLVHEIIERFGKSFAPPLAPENQSAAWSQLREIALHAISEAKIRPLLREVETHRFLGYSDSQPGGMLGKMLLAEIAQQSGLQEKPAFAAPLFPLALAGISLPPEFKLGIELRLPVRPGQLRIEGRIDRILVSADGQTLAIIDYKTEHAGNLPRFSNANWGFDFQLALYLLAARAQLREWRENAAASTPVPRLAAAFFALREGEWMHGFGEDGTLGRNQTKTGPGKIWQSNAKELDAEMFHFWLDEIEKRISHLGEFLQRAQFNISMQDEKLSGCKYCDFKTSCRRDDAVAQARLNAAHANLQRDAYLPLPILE